MLTNKGLGPAIIESANILYKGKEYYLEMEDFLDNQLPDIYNYGELVQSSTWRRGATLVPNETVSIYTFEISLFQMPDLYAYLGIEPEDSPFDIEIVYSSIFEEKWIVRNEELGYPVRID